MTELKKFSALEFINTEEELDTYVAEHVAEALRGSQQAERAVPVEEFDLKTSGGGRGYVAWHFANIIERHDFDKYIKSDLAADFACALALWLRDGQVGRAAPVQQAAPVVDAEMRKKAERYDYLRDCDLDAMAAKYWPDGQVPVNEALDAAIDAALASQKDKP